MGSKNTRAAHFFSAFHIYFLYLKTIINDNMENTPGYPTNVHLQHLRVKAVSEKWRDFIYPMLEAGMVTSSGSLCLITTKHG